MPRLRCRVVRWVADEPNPGWVEVQFTDIHCEVWGFFDKPPIFETPGNAPLTRSTAYPVEIEMPVIVVDSQKSDQGAAVATISLPWGPHYDSAQDTFEVLSEHVLDD
jgi:hypothetical protein